MPLFAPTAVNALPPPARGWQLFDLPNEDLMKDAPILVYEEMMDDTPESVVKSIPKTGFGDANRLPFVKCFHLVHPCSEQVVHVKSTTKVSLAVKSNPAYRFRLSG